MNKNLENIYTHHHQTNRERGFSIMKDERGVLLRDFIGKGKKVLDIGCRDGVLTKYFADGNEVLGLDIDNLALEEAKTSLGIEVMNIDLNGDWKELGDRKFDVVVAGEVLEHLYYPEKVIGKILAHLNHNGLFLGSVPNAFSLKNRLRYLKGSKRFTPLSDPTHINHFSYAEFNNLLKNHFSDVRVIGLGRFKALSRILPSLVAFDFFFICIR